VFDILPLNGILVKGQTEIVEFIYTANQNREFKTTAICQIEGGPDYEVTIRGKSSRMDFSITPSSHMINLHEVQFNEWQQTEFMIKNT